MPHIYDHLGIRRDIEDLRAVEMLFKLKEKHGSNPWPAISKIIDLWIKKHPTKWDSHLIYVDDIRNTRKDRKYASSKDSVTHGIIRYTLDIPQHILFMIRCLYSPEELPMDREFLLTFARKFPAMRVAEKV